jgi:hypothetical protein
MLTLLSTSLIGILLSLILGIELEFCNPFTTLPPSNSIGGVIFFILCACFIVLWVTGLVGFVKSMQRIVYEVSEPLIPEIVIQK